MRVFALFLLLCATALAASAHGPLDDLARIDAGFTSHRASSYNPTGENRDWWWFEPGETKTLLDASGAGIIHHLWMTIGSTEARYGSRMVLRTYWDGRPYPSVEVPVGDFFGAGFGYQSPFANALFEVSAEGRARNSFIPMPFARGARITLTNESRDNRCRVFYYVDYRKYDRLPRNLGRFHAQYRQQFPCTDGNFTIVEATGEGRYLGCHLSCKNNRDAWMGEGDDMIYIDGDSFPTLYGTGTEDYFADAWGFRAFAHPYHGLSMFLGAEWKNAVHTAYRYHVQDPIVFKKSIRVTLEHGSRNDRADDWASVGFWYQKQPVSVAGTLPPVDARLLPYPAVIDVATSVRLPGEELFGKLQAAGGPLEVQDLTSRGMLGVRQLLFKNTRPEGRLGLMLRNPGQPANCRLRLRLCTAPDYGVWQVFVDSLPLGSPIDLYSEKVSLAKPLDLGTIRLETGEKLIELRCLGKNGWSTGRLLGLVELELTR
ncbi:DUF2961 domain-containing protein [bacterium]|nr:DUF2961 domain-containing protein [bacterium]